MSIHNISTALQMKLHVLNVNIVIHSFKFNLKYSLSLIERVILMHLLN